MNIYHIAYAPDVKTAHIYLWGCNLNCRGCVLKQEIYDPHLEETKDALFTKEREISQTPLKFLDVEEDEEILERLEIRMVIFTGAEPALDPQLPQLAEFLHKKFGSHNILFTNGFKLTDLEHMDKVVFGIPAVTESLYRQYTGKSNKTVLNNFIRLNQLGTKLGVQSIFIPDYIESLEIENIAKFIAKVNEGIPYVINAYIPVGDNPWRQPAPEEVEEAATKAKKHLLNVNYLAGNAEVKFEVLRVF